MADIDLDALLADSRIEIGRIPAGANGGGEDLRGSPEFETLEAEFRKIETAGPAAVDWKMLNRVTIELLRDRSKDLVLASRLVYGLHREEGYRGLAVGISIIHGIVEKHWETMFPPLNRERGRAGSFDWIAEKLAPAIEATPPAEDKKIFALIAHDRLVDLDTLLAEKLTRFPAALGPLIRALRPHARDARQALDAMSKPAAEPAAPTAAPQPEAAPAPPPTSVVPAVAPALVASAGPVVELALGDDTQKAFEVLSNAALRLAATARQQVPSDARAYHAARFALWSGLTAAPPDKGGKTSLPPPQKAKRAEIQALRAAGNHQGLLLSAESAFASSPFWLDAHQIAFEAMTALGSDYDQAKLTIAGDLAALLQRIPALTGLCFNDGTPFAEAETLGWIAGDVRNGSGAEMDAGGDASLGSAVKLAQAGQTLAGLKLLMHHSQTRRGARERFIARLDMGEFCLRFELLQPLIALLESLAACAELQTLESWEPELAARLSSLSWRTVTHKNAKRFIDEKDILLRKSRILGQLANLDIVMAAELAQP